MVEETDKAEKGDSKAELGKRNSRHLRGTIAETLASGATHFEGGDKGLLKFHGTYQQDDRDLRHENRKKGQEEAYQFMIRCAIPGGVVTADQPRRVRCADQGQSFMVEDDDRPEKTECGLHGGVGI